MPGDGERLLAMFDRAVAWLAARGRSAQWGDKPWSTDPVRTERVHRMAADPGFRVAELDGEPAGALLLEDHPPAHVPVVAEAELYVGLLITDRRFAGYGIGSALLERARAEAREREIELLRVDCWAGGGGDLVRYYTGQGFTPTVQFDYHGWIGQVFEQRVRSMTDTPAAGGCVTANEPLPGSGGPAEMGAP
ncbi:GNAT family N-acetyltransferase [Amycolatopsis palatopharyngis]|uniref:GNAT family N-acetyltransferase n=1 Tax=Amycolatopsis palatopharyngis TaxID=187982 RepID=UPI000E271ED4